jgi:hypothetical protein
LNEAIQKKRKASLIGRAIHSDTPAEMKLGISTEFLWIENSEEKESARQIEQIRHTPIWNTDSERKRPELSFEIPHCPQYRHE